MFNFSNKYIKFLELQRKGMPVSLRILPLRQDVLRTNICLHLVARGSRQPLPTTFTWLSPEQDTSLATELVTDGQVAVLTSRNHT